MLNWLRASQFFVCFVFSFWYCGSICSTVIIEDEWENKARWMHGYGDREKET